MNELSSKLEAIYNEVNSDHIKLVSFDVFDTLLLRPCLNPTDIFKIVRKKTGFNGNFEYLRKMAEVYARKNKPYYVEDITIDAIYEEFINLSACSEKEADILKNTEIEVEKELLYPRESIKALFDKVVENGKIVVITSDIYLPKKFLVEILTKNGFSGYQKIYVSCEEKITKGSGRLFEKIIADFSEYEILPEEMIHLGDNSRADVNMPRKKGLRAIHLPKPSAILASKDTLNETYRLAQNFDDTFLLGVLANYLFDDPYREFRKYTYGNGEDEALGAVLYGPLLLSYVIWMLAKANEQEVDKLLMVYRDGYIIEKICGMFDGIVRIPKLSKIYLSRNVRYRFYARQSNGLANSLLKFPIRKDMTIRNFIERRILVSNPETMNEIWAIFRESGYDTIDDSLGDEKRYVHLFPKLQPFFYETIKYDIDNIEDYCRTVVGDCSKLGVVDVGYRGSVGEFLKNEAGIDSVTFQLFETSQLRNIEKSKYHINSFYEYGLSTVQKLQILHSLTEDVISIQEGSATNVRINEGEYLIEHENFDGENETLKKMQEGILKFCEYAIEHLKDELDGLSFDNDLYIDILFGFLQKPNEYDAKVIRKLAFKDSIFLTTDDQNIYQKWFLAKGFKEFDAVIEDVPLPESNITTEEDKQDYSILEQQPWEKISKVHLLAIKICEKLHLITYAIKLKRWLRDPFGTKHNKKLIDEIFVGKLEKSLEDIRNLSVEGKTCLIVGAMTSFDKGVCAYLNKLSKVSCDEKFLLLSEANPNGTHSKIEFDAVMVPDYILKEVYQTDTGIKCPRKIRQRVNKIEYLTWAVNNLTSRYFDMEKDYAYLCTYYMEKYISDVLEMICPYKIIIWNEFFAYHHILKCVAERQGINFYFMEFGSLPGTLSIEREGQMGKSFPGLHVEEFVGYEIDQTDIDHAKNVINYLKDSRLNRNIQPITGELFEVKKRIRKDRPIVLYAGVNDFESGLNPYTDETSKYHSPFLKSSEEVLTVLSDLAEQNNWNLIYKPHPLMIKTNHYTKMISSNVILALDVDINDVIDMSDVVVTILSQVSYISLIRGKATLMLGYTQLKDKGCCYQAFSADLIQSQIESAIRNGLTEEMKNAFDRHLAQMLRYNLFYDYVQRELTYGKKIEAAVEYLSC